MLKFMENVKFGMLMKHMTDTEWAECCKTLVKGITKIGIKVLGNRSGICIYDADENPVMEVDIMECTAPKVIYDIWKVTNGYVEYEYDEVGYPILVNFAD